MGLPLDEECHVQQFARQMLQSTVFIGTYQSRQLVEPIKSYRDVVIVDEAETNVKHKLDLVRKRVDKFYNGAIWIGITGPKVVGTPAGHCIWSLLDVPFGTYWFQVRNVKFNDHGEMLLRLKILRKIEVCDFQLRLNSENKGEARETSSERIVVDLTQFCQFLYTTFLQLATRHNMIELIRFVAVIIVAITSSLADFTYYAAEYFLRALHEFSNCIQAMMPLLLAIVDFFSKCVGGLLILIYTMWQGRTQSQYPTKLHQLPALAKQHTSLTYKR